MAWVRSGPVGVVWPPSSPPLPRSMQRGRGPGLRRPSRHAASVHRHQKKGRRVGHACSHHVH
eukprot:11791744-Alexandrium_andersonii.AAC.1